MSIRALVGPVQLLRSGTVDAAHGTITLPLYRGRLAGTKKNVWYILTDVSDFNVVAELGLKFSTKLQFSSLAARTGNLDAQGNRPDQRSQRQGGLFESARPGSSERSDRRHLSCEACGSETLPKLHRGAVAKENMNLLLICDKKQDDESRHHTHCCRVAGYPAHVGNLEESSPLKLIFRSRNTSGRVIPRLRRANPFMLAHISSCRL
jgi:hypothetical protein